MVTIREVTYLLLQVTIPIPELCQHLIGNLSAYPIGKVRAIVPIPFPYNLLFHYKVFRELDRIRLNVVEILGFRLGNGTAVVLQQHADVMSELVRSLGVALTFSHE